MNDQVRKDFEDWASRHPYLSKCRKNRNRFAQNDYFDPVMFIAWRVWQSVVIGEEAIVPNTHWGAIFEERVGVTGIWDYIKERKK